MRLRYPTEERIIEYNLLVLTLVRIKKKDRAGVLAPAALREIITGCREVRGDVYDKAAYLLVHLVKRHPFESGNRRTAFVVAKDFLLRNAARCRVEDDPTNSRVMTGVREGYYTQDEIRRWLEHGEIREFRR